MPCTWADESTREFDNIPEGLKEDVGSSVILADFQIMNEGFRTTRHLASDHVWLNSNWASADQVAYRVTP